MTGLDTRLAELLGVRFPIVQAPMAGVTTPELVAAVSNADALGSFGGGTTPPDGLRETIRAIRNLTAAPFAVNLFSDLPRDEPAPGAVEAMRTFLAPHAEAAGVELGEPRHLPWSVEDQLAVVLEERPAVFSFTFGLVDPEPFREAGIVVLGTATTVDEARVLEEAGVDAVVVQGAEAGGHRGTFVGSFEKGLVPLARLLPAVAGAVSVPVVAAGGIMDGAAIAASLELGAEGAQLGTAFLFSPESAVTAEWRRALLEAETVVTPAYTGRHARAASTLFLSELMEGPEPLSFPLQAAVLQPFRGHHDYGFFMGGTGSARGRELAAAELVRTLVLEAESAPQ